MTVKDVREWCKANGIDARGIIRGGEFFIRHASEETSSNLPTAQQVLHWDLHIGERRLPASPSDMERLVTGKIRLENLIQAMSREGRGPE
jgi:hypothetical protein